MGVPVCSKVPWQWLSAVHLLTNFVSQSGVTQKNDIVERTENAWGWSWQHSTTHWDQRNQQPITHQTIHEGVCMCQSQETATRPC